MFSYGYDSVGNLSNRVQNLLTNVFQVNALNQLTSVVRTNNSATLAGVSSSTAAGINISINGAAPQGVTQYADNTFERSGVTLADGTNTFVAVGHDGAGNWDTNTVSAYLPVAVTFLYDLNGNLRTNGTRVFDYDDENQLTRITEPSAWKSEFVYDGKMRLRISREYTWQAGAWLQTNETRRVYDGMLVLQERNSLNAPQVTYTRGLDLSGTFEGAGGIGGLLAFTEHGASALEHSYYHADGNENVTCLVDTNQNVVGRYLFDPFGNTLSISGAKAGINRYRFSSKETHAASGLVYYGYRFYDPNLQRWPNRDPIQEEGGYNLYAFIHNDPLARTDAYGLADDPAVESINRILNSLREQLENAKSQQEKDRIIAQINHYLDRLNKYKCRPKPKCDPPKGGPGGRGGGGLRGGGHPLLLILPFATDWLYETLKKDRRPNDASCPQASGNATA